jgi:hypothetical protein
VLVLPIRKTYSDEEIFVSLRRAVKILCRRPLRREYEKYRNDSEPTADTIARRFGSWKEALIAAGIDPKDPEQNPNFLTDGEILGHLQEIARVVGHTPSVAEYNALRRPHMACSTTVSERFGGRWEYAIEAAGLPERSSNKIERERIKKALQEVARKLGHSPTKSEYKANRAKDMPSEKAISRNFDPWADALKAAGLKACKYSHTGCRYSDEEVAKCLHVMAEKLGHTPSLKEYVKYHGPDMPNDKTLRIRYGSWPLALKAAGFEDYDAKSKDHRVVFEEKYSDEEVREALVAVADKVGHAPSRNEYGRLRPDGSPSLNTVVRRYKTWMEALRRNGLLDE